MMNRKYTYILLVIIITTVLFFAERYADNSSNFEPKVTSKPESDTKSEFGDRYFPSSTTGVVVSHDYYSLSYSEEHEQAEWVAYELKRSQLSQNEFERPYFELDNSVNSKSAHWRNYKNSGWDRGHLCPAGDRRFTYHAYKETFLTSNISPQDHDFNGGVWRILEQKVRYWGKKYDGVFVITGGVLENGLKTIGDEDVTIPNEFYKIVVDISEENIKAIAFLIPNRPTERPFSDFVVTIDQIEAKTNIDFFTFLSNAEEAALEAKINTKAWGIR